MEARKAERHRQQTKTEVEKAHDRAKVTASRTLAKVAPLLAELLPKVHDVNNNNEETERFKQLGLLAQTRLKSSIKELHTLKQISCDCLSGSLRDVDFDQDDVKHAVRTATAFLWTLDNIMESAAAVDGV